jgi:hypothetical protein
MSQARLSYVKSSRKAGKCEKCGVELPPKSAYRYFYVGFRSNWKHIRCMDAACNPKMSELESSKLAQVYAAMEDAESSIRSCTDWDGIKEALDDLSNSIRDTASEYEEASQTPNGDVFNTDAEERAQNLESAADEIDEIDHEDECSADCEKCSGSGQIEEGDESVECDVCEGSGKVTGEGFDEIVESIIGEIWDVSLDG